jgi:hypothetical protein
MFDIDLRNDVFVGESNLQPPNLSQNCVTVVGH